MRIRGTIQEAARVHGLCPRNRSKHRESSSHRKDAGTNRYQRRATDHWKARSPESFHQQIGRTHAAILPAAQKRREIRVDRGSPQGIRGPEEDTLNTTNTGGAQRRRKIVPLCGSTQQCGEHSARRRTKRRGQNPEHTKANLLPQHAPDQVPATIPTLPEATSGHHHDFKESIALLRRAPHHNREQCTTRRHPQQPRSDWASRRVEHRAQPTDLQFKHPTAIKAQVVPYFLVEWTEVQTPGPPDLSNSWTMFFDGSKRQQGAGAGVVLVSPKDQSSDMFSRSTSA